MSIPLGLRAPFLGVVLTLVLVALGAAFASVSYALALTLKGEDAFAPLLDAVVLPVGLLSGILLPMTLAPCWLQGVSDVIPIKHAGPSGFAGSAASRAETRTPRPPVLAGSHRDAARGRHQHGWDCWGEWSLGGGTRRLLVTRMSLARSSVRSGRRAALAVHGRPGWC